MKIDLKSMNMQELAQELENQPKYRAKQLFEWLQGGAKSFDEMSNLPKELRAKLADSYMIPTVKIQEKLVSKIDDTVKYLFSLYDGQTVEAVLMHYHHGYSICISTQVGCKMRCDFCATGQSGFVRDLLPAEMIGQIQAAAEDRNIRISNVVMMGMGEPLDNYDNVLRFLELVGLEEGLCIGMRHISLSTCGIADKIYDLADRGYQLTLSVSIHAPNDEIRKKTMPVATKWDMNSLLKGCKYYSDVTKRRISFEYAMIDGVNDSDDCARELASRLRGILAHINLIPVNPIEETAYEKSSKDRLKKFAEILNKSGYTATIRRTLGADINASCGQLRTQKGR